MSKLDRIQVRGYKSIREMDLELRPLNILIGANGAGKSNFVSLFRLLNAVVSRRLQLFVGKAGGADALLHFGTKTTPEIACRFRSEDVDRSFILLPAIDGSVVICGKEQDAEVPLLDGSFPVSPGHARDEAGLHPEALFASETLGQWMPEEIVDWGVYHFHDTSDSAGVKQLCDIRDNRILRSDGSNLASILYLLKETHPDHYRNIVETVRMAAPFFDDFDLRPTELNENRIRLDWLEKGQDTYFGPEMLSDGTLRFVCLATLLLQPKLPSVIIIDEPELGLHPYAINLLASMLKSVSTRAEVIVCTQSVTLVNQFVPEDVIVVDREDGQSVFRRLSSEDTEAWLEDYALGDLWEKNIIGGRPSL